MSKQAILTGAAPKAIGPYSQAIESGALVFCSGQIGIDPATGFLVEGGIEPETRRVLDNLKAVLAVANLTLDDVVKSTIFLANLADFRRGQSHLRRIFPRAVPRALDG